MRLKKVLSVVLAALLVLNALAFSRCNADKAARNVVAAGYDVYLALDAAANAAKAFHTAGRITTDDYKAVLKKLDGLRETARRLNAHFENLPFVDASNKLAIIQAAQDLSNEIGSALADGLLKRIEEKTQAQIRRWFFVGSTVVDGIKIAISAIQTTTPLAKVLISEETALTARSQVPRGFTDADAELVRQLSSIGSNFAAKIVSQRGQSIETLRQWSAEAHQALVVFIASEIARV